MTKTLAPQKRIRASGAETSLPDQTNGIVQSHRAYLEVVSPSKTGAQTSLWTNFIRARCSATHSHGGATDLILCILCFLVVHRLYLGSLDLTPERLIVFLVSPFILWLALAASGSHTASKMMSLTEAATRVTVAWILAFMAVGLFVYFTKLAEPVSRGWIGLSMITSLCALYCTRVAHFAVSSYRFGDQQTSVVIVGSLDTASSLALRANNDERDNTNVKAIFSYSDVDSPEANDNTLADQVLNYIEERRANSDPIQQVWIALPSHDRYSFDILNDRLLSSSVDVCVVLNDYEVQLISGSRRSLDGTEIVNISDVRLPPRAESVKRIFDCVLAGFGLFLLAPLMLVIALSILISSRGPILFKQRRFGLDGREIEVWKFRTMFHSTKQDTSIPQAVRNDSRVTRVGGFLRRTSLDELPQLCNVLQGTMSLVGPRPHAVEHSHKYRKLVSGYMLRHKIKPGITGWAQVNGWRGETDTLEKMQNRIKFDVAYIRNWSLWLDIQIVARTALTILFDRNAY